MWLYPIFNWKCLYPIFSAFLHVLASYLSSVLSSVLSRVLFSNLSRKKRKRKALCCIWTIFQQILQLPIFCDLILNASQYSLIWLSLAFGRRTQVFTRWADVFLHWLVTNQRILRIQVCVHMRTFSFICLYYTSVPTQNFADRNSRLDRGTIWQ